MNALAATTIQICWLLFLAYWIITAFKVKAVVERQTPRAAFSYKLPTLLGGLWLWWPDWCPGFSQLLYDRPEWLRLLAALICVSGLFVAFWARWTLAFRLLLTEQSISQDQDRDRDRTRVAELAGHGGALASIQAHGATGTTCALVGSRSAASAPSHLQHHST